MIRARTFARRMGYSRVVSAADLGVDDGSRLNLEEIDHCQTIASFSSLHHLAVQICPRDVF